MNKPAVLLSVLALAAGAGIWWLQGHGPSRGTAQPSAQTAPAAHEGQPVELSAPTDRAESAAPAASLSAPEAAGQDRRAVEHAVADRALQGRVHVPAHAPADSTVRVLALSKSLGMEEIYGKEGVLAKLTEHENFAKGEQPATVLASAPVDPAGAFELRVPGDPKVVWLAIDGRFLYSSSPARVDLEANPAPELTAKLGGCIQGRVQLPRGTQADPAVLRELEIELNPDSGNFSMLALAATPLFERRAFATDLGTFEFRGVDATHAYELEVNSKDAADWSLDSLRLKEGLVLPIDVQLLDGASVRGRVVEGNRGVQGAKVAAAKSEMWGFAGERLAETETDADGAFALEHVPPGKSLLIAQLEGYLESEPVKLDLSDGAVYDGMTLALEDGESVSGKVRFEDGTVAAQCEVSASFDPAAMMGMGAANAARGASGKTTADADGRFTVRGLGKGPFVLEASVERDGDGDEKDAWRGKLKGISPGAQDLELVLGPPCKLEGKVVDPSNAPVPEFEVHATIPGEVFFMPGESKRESFKDEGGEFALRDLEQGTWKVVVRAEGFAPTAQVEVLLPRQDSTPLVFALAPAAGIAGKVLDPEGRPVSDAKVTLQVEASQSMQRLTGRLELPECRSGEEGEFLLSGLNPGKHSIYAAHAKYATSTPVSAEVSSGEVAEGIVLELRRGALLTGEVYGKDGRPSVGTRVIVQDTSTWEMTMARSDDVGFFRVENLRPGSWNVTAILDGSGSGDETATAAEDDDTATAGFIDNMRFTMVQLEEGEEEHVVLGAPPKDPVKVSGHVTHGDEPLDTGLLSFLREGAKGMESLKMVSLDGEGRYEVELDSPGRYHVQVQITGGSSAFQQHNVEFQETIPEKEEHRLDFSLPLGSISGTVVGPDRNALPGARVTLSVDGAIETGTFMGGQYSEATTDDAGRYSFDYLRPSTYRVAAGGALYGGAFGTNGDAGRVVHSGIEVGEGERADGIDFQLDEPGVIAGTVVDGAGLPVANASIFVRDSAGRLLELFSMTSSGEDGIFRYTGVAPGEYLVSARAKGLASAESAGVRVSSGKSSSVQLVLGPGTRLLVEIVNKSDEFLVASLSVVDSQGRQVNGMIGWSEISQSFADGFSYTEQSIGPLPPGNYTVTATTKDGRKASRPVILDGQSERKLKLRID